MDTDGCFGVSLEEYLDALIGPGWHVEGRYFFDGRKRVTKEHVQQRKNKVQGKEGTGLLSPEPLPRSPPCPKFEYGANMDTAASVTAALDSFDAQYGGGQLEGSDDEPTNAVASGIPLNSDGEAH